MKKTQSRPGSVLANYMHYVSEEGLDLERFVEHGARLLSPEELTGLAAGMVDLREKITTLSGELPRLGRQLGFLADLFESEEAEIPKKVRGEVAFTLLYAAQDMDLIPDELPDVGYIDDAAITEVTLTRNAGFLAEYCAKHQIDWTSLAPRIHE